MDYHHFIMSLIYAISSIIMLAVTCYALTKKRSLPLVLFLFALILASISNSNYIIVNYCIVTEIDPRELPVLLTDIGKIIFKLEPYIATFYSLSLISVILMIARVEK